MPTPIKRQPGVNRAQGLANQVIEEVRQNKPMDVPNALVQHSRAGTCIIPLDDPAGAASKGLRARYHQITSIGDDYLIGVTCEVGADGRAANAGGTSVYIAKNWRHRKTPFHNKTWNGISYVYSSNVERVATSPTKTETQVITPPYVVGDIILAGTGFLGVGALGLIGRAIEGSRIVWLDLNDDGRAWSRKSAA
jgi:hypothetical protein